MHARLVVVVFVVVSRRAHLSPHVDLRQSRQRECLWTRCGAREELCGLSVRGLSGGRRTTTSVAALTISRPCRNEAATPPSMPLSGLFCRHGAHVYPTSSRPACASCVSVSHQCLEDRPGDEEEELRGQRQHLHPVGARVFERSREDVDAEGDHHQTRGEEHGKQRVVELEHGHQQHLASHDHLRKHRRGYTASGGLLWRIPSPSSSMNPRICLPCATAPFQTLGKAGERAAALTGSSGCPCPGCLSDALAPGRGTSLRTARRRQRGR